MVERTVEAGSSLPQVDNLWGCLVWIFTKEGTIDLNDDLRSKVKSLYEQFKEKSQIDQVKMM